MSAEEKKDLQRLATDYGMDSSSMMRAMVQYFKDVRPILQVSPVGKGSAPAPYTMLSSALRATLTKRSAVTA